MACCGVSWVLMFTYAIISENLLKSVQEWPTVIYSDGCLMNICNKPVCIYSESAMLAFTSLSGCIHSPFQGRRHCFWTCAGRKRWKRFQPWEPGRAARCWARVRPTPSQPAWCCSAPLWYFLLQQCHLCCCRGSSVLRGAAWKSAKQHAKDSNK